MFAKAVVVSFIALIASYNSHLSNAFQPTTSSVQPRLSQIHLYESIKSSDDHACRNEEYNSDIGVKVEDCDGMTSRRSMLKYSISAAAAATVATATTGSTSSWMGTSSIALAADASGNYNYESVSGKTIVITGCNSGIGYDAVKRLAARSYSEESSSSTDGQIILACRSLSKAQDTMKRLTQDLDGKLNVKLLPYECDLANLSSVSKFAQDISRDLNGRSIDILCLNAGLARNAGAKDIVRTKDGFELTIGTNHLGHFKLVQSLQPLLKTKGDKDSPSRIVVTASGVHDPESPGGAQGSKATLGDLSGLEQAVSKKVKEFDMIDGESFDADKAYKDSKLCNVLFTRQLQKRLDADNTGINVNCFNPGLIVSTGLFRDQNQFFTKVFDFAATDLLKVGETIEFGGGALEYMALDKNVGLKGGQYYTSPPGSSKYGDAAFGQQFALTSVSKEAMDDAKAKRLWELSEILVKDVV